MRRYLLRRLAQGAAVLFVVSAVIFAIVHAAPGGPALLNNPDVDPRMAKEMEKLLGLDDPLPVQYARWLANAVQGNLGRSYQHSLGTAELLWARIPNTLLLSGTALRLAVVFAIPLGMISAVKRYSPLDYAATVTAFFGVSLVWIYHQTEILAMSKRVKGYPDLGIRDALAWAHQIAVQ